MPINSTMTAPPHIAIRYLALRAPRLLDGGLGTSMITRLDEMRCSTVGVAEALIL